MDPLIAVRSVDKFASKKVKSRNQYKHADWFPGINEWNLFSTLVPWLRLQLAPPPLGSAPCPPQFPLRSSSRPVTQQHLQAAHKSSLSSPAITQHLHLIHLLQPRLTPPHPTSPSALTHWLQSSLSKHSHFTKLQPRKSNDEAAMKKILLL